MIRRRAIIAPVVLVAFLLQISLVQTHIHLPPLAAAGLGDTATVTLSPHLHPARGLGDANQAHCPWCQAVLSNGTYLTPTAPPIALPVAFRFLDPIIPSARGTLLASSHAWQSRAPPA